MSWALEAACSEKAGVRVWVERAGKRRPDVNDALCEWQVLVVAVRLVGRQGCEDVIQLAGVTPMDAGARTKRAEAMWMKSGRQISMRR